MEIITREIIRKKGDRHVLYKFSTFDFVLSRATADISLMNRVVAHLREAFIYGMADHEKSPSGQNGLLVDAKLVESDLSTLAHKSEYYGKTNKQHETVERYFLENDPFTIAVEVPVWDHEFAWNIDIIRVVDGRVQVLDFKPDAHKEKKVTGQLFKYGQLLSKCTGISVTSMDFFYFDGNKVFQLIF